MRIGAVLTAATALAVALPTAGAQAAAAHCEQAGSTTTYCYQLISTAKSSFKTLWSDGLVNDTGAPVSLTCHVDKTVTDSASVSSSISASMKVALVGDMNASVSATVSTSVSTTIGTSITYSVPAHSVTYCDRGEYRYVGTIRKTGASGQHALPTTTFNVTAPSTVMWRARTQKLS